MTSERLLAATDIIGHRVEAGLPLRRRLLRLWLAVMLILLPVDLARLPLNVDLADCWILMALPFLWLSFVRGQRIIGLSYTIPMWIIIVSSVASTFVAIAPVLSLVAIAKEVFLFVLFVTMAAVFYELDSDDLRFVLAVWAGAAMLHGCLIVAQFLFPPVWRVTAALTGRSTAYVHYRPTGLLANANKAALHQLFGYVPVMLWSPSPRVTMILGVALLPTVLATGSMAAAIAFLAGLMAALIATSLGGRLVPVLKVLMRLTIVVLLLGALALAVIGPNTRAREHLARILLGRTDRSSESRFSLWQRGIAAYVDHGALLWGIGPENFRVVDGGGNQLHNDLVAFSVERGLLGMLGLVLFAGLAVVRAAYMVRVSLRSPDRTHLVAVIFLAAMVAAIVESLTHQTFHTHEVWLVLALQEATLLKMTTAEGESRQPSAGWAVTASARSTRSREQRDELACRSS